MTVPKGKSATIEAFRSELNPARMSCYEDSINEVNIQAVDHVLFNLERG